MHLSNLILILLVQIGLASAFAPSIWKPVTRTNMPAISSQARRSVTKFVRSRRHQSEVHASLGKAVIPMQIPPPPNMLPAQEEQPEIQTETCRQVIDWMQQWGLSKLKKLEKLMGLNGHFQEFFRSIFASQRFREFLDTPFEVKLFGTKLILHAMQANLQMPNNTNFQVERIIPKNNTRLQVLAKDVTGFGLVMNLLVKFINPAKPPAESPLSQLPDKFWLKLHIPISLVNFKIEIDLKMCDCAEGAFASLVRGSNVHLEVEPSDLYRLGEDISSSIGLANLVRVESEQEVKEADIQVEIPVNGTSIKKKNPIQEFLSNSLLGPMLWKALNYGIHSTVSAAIENFQKDFVGTCKEDNIFFTRCKAKLRYFIF